MLVDLCYHTSSIQAQFFTYRAVGTMCAVIWYLHIVLFYGGILNNMASDRSWHISLCTVSAYGWHFKAPNNLEFEQRDNIVIYMSPYGPNCIPVEVEMIQS